MKGRTMRRRAGFGEMEPLMPTAELPADSLAETVRLVIVAGIPGTGKTTLARMLSAQLRAAYVRTDAIATAVLRCAPSTTPTEAGAIAYEVAYEVALGNLRASTPVVVDGVHASHSLRSRWGLVARSERARLTIFETTLPDPAEHRRRVERRRPDIDGSAVPTWLSVRAAPYDAWHEVRDGSRQVVDMTDPHRGLQEALAALSRG